MLWGRIIFLDRISLLPEITTQEASHEIVWKNPGKYDSH